MPQQQKNRAPEHHGEDGVHQLPRALPQDGADEARHLLPREAALDEGQHLRVCGEGQG